MAVKSALKSAGAALMMSGLLIAPALAATNTLSGTLNKTDNCWRASAINGANVYNSSDQQIGTVKGLLITSSGKVSDAVISVGGDVGVGNKLVKVPFSKLKFEPSQNGNSGNSQKDYSVVYPGATTQSLKNMSSFSFNT